MTGIRFVCRSHLKEISEGAERTSILLSCDTSDSEGLGVHSHLQRAVPVTFGDYNSRVAIERGASCRVEMAALGLCHDSLFCLYGLP